MPRILTVDDSVAMRQMVEVTLTSAGYDVKQAENGVEALSIANSQSFDLVITDVNMPQMDGLTFIRALRRQALPTGSTPALVTSTEAAAQDRTAARAAGANFYLVKPVDRDSLVEFASMLTGVSR